MTFDSTRRSMNSNQKLINESRAVVGQTGSTQAGSSQRKRMAAVGLAAAMAAPQWLMQFSNMSAARGATTQPSNDGTAPQSSNTDIINLASDQYTAGEFLQASTTLQKIDPRKLSDSDHSAFLQLSNRANHAAIDQMTAREDLMLGRDALSSGRTSEAQDHFKAIAANAHADAATKKEATEQLALIGGSGIGGSGIGDSSSKSAVVAAASPVAAQSAVSREDGAIAYSRARSEYRSGDMVAARRDFVLARDGGYQPGLMEGLAPQEYLTRMDEKAKADALAVVQNANGPRTASGSFNGSSQTVNLAQNAPSNQQAQLDTIAAQQKAAKAKDLVSQGADAEGKKDYKGALSSYQLAVDADPGNADAVSGRDRMLSQLGLTPVGSGASALQGTATQIGLEHDAIQLKFNVSVDNAKKALDSKDYETAQDQVANATAEMQEDPNVFSAAEIGGMKGTVDALNAQLHGAQSTAKQQADMAAIVASGDANRQRLTAEEENRQHAISSLIQVARTYQQQKDYAGMLGVLDQILALQPTNDYAVQMRPSIEEQAYTQEQKKWRIRFDTQYMRQIVTSEEMQVPYADQVVYPDNWPEISELRDSETQNSDLSKEDQAVQLQLARELPKIAFEATALSEILGGSGTGKGFLSDVTGANIIVNWTALAVQNVDKTTPITLSLSNVRFKKVLQLVLDQAAGGAKKLGYTVSDGIIEISSIEDLSAATVTKVYDIRDLLVNPNFTPQAGGISAPSLTGGSATGGGGGSTGGGSVSVTTGSNTTSQQTLLLIETHIMNEVEPDSWKSTGTGQGYIDDWNQSLIITQTPEVQAEIQSLLDKLRATEAVQVTVECRFLVVDRNFMNDVNVNLQVGYTPPLNSAWSNGGAGISLINATNGFTQFPTTGVPGSIGSNAQGETFNTGYITSDWQITLLIRATQAERHESVVQSPRVTLESGQAALIEEYTSTPYVSSLAGLVGTGASTVTPVISYATNGVALSVLGCWVSADRKYVTLDLQPILQQLLGFSTFTFQQTSSSTAAVTATGTATGIVTIGTVIIVSPPATLSIQEPTEATTTVSTRVIVPDGGTLMMGGVTIAGELDLEAGVPGLSKIPLLKRLVTNNSNAKDEEVVLILVKPTILINKEVEAKQFPLLTSSQK